VQVPVDFMSDSQINSTPENSVTRHCLEQLRSHPKRVVFTEGEDIRVLQAAARLVELEVVAPILLGNRERIHALAKDNSIPMTFIKVIDPPHGSDFQLFCQMEENMARYRKLQTGNTEEIVARPHYFGALMVQYGQADALVGGNQALPASYFRALLHTIKPMPEVPKIFGVTILIGPHLQHLGGDGVLFLADTGLVPDPDVRELAAIALETGKLARHFLGRRPLVAMLSHSTKGSATNPQARRMAAATSLAQGEVARQFLEIDIEGELQADVALDPAAAEIKLPGAERRHTADVLVFPNLDAAQISLKLLQHVAGARNYGQLILGLTRPTAQVPRTASAETIFGTAAAVAVEAIKYHQLHPEGVF
jgi:phosphate acetyltransferase